MLHVTFCKWVEIRKMLQLYVSSSCLCWPHKVYHSLAPKFCGSLAPKLYPYLFADHLRRNVCETHWNTSEICAKQSKKNDTMGHLKVRAHFGQTILSFTFGINGITRDMHLWGLYVVTLDVRRITRPLGFFVAALNVRRAMPPLRFVCCYTYWKKSHDTFRVCTLLYLM